MAPRIGSCANSDSTEDPMKERECLEALKKEREQVCEDVAAEDSKEADASEPASSSSAQVVEGEVQADGTEAAGVEMECPLDQHISNAEISKWSDMVEGVGISQYMRTHPDRFRRRVRRGVPAQFRWEVWKAALHLNTHDVILSQDYPSLSSRQNEWTKTIEIDIARTFPDLKSFGEVQQKKLWRVLNAYASYNPGLGYCQGMNFVCGLLLIVSDFKEEESFHVLAVLMDNAGLAGFYGDKLPLFRRYLHACDMLVKETVPDLREHFKRENVNAPVYLHQWFLTLFINCFPLSMVTIIWDVIISEGLEVVLRIAVSILQVLKDSLLAMQFEEIIKFFKMMKTYNDEDGELNAFRIGQLLMKHSEHVKVPQNILDELRSDAPDEDFFCEFDEAPEADSVNSGTWLSGWSRALSGFMNGPSFSYGSTKRRPPARQPPLADEVSGEQGTASSDDTPDIDETITRSWEFL